MGLLLALESYAVVHAASRVDAFDQVVLELPQALGRKLPTLVLTGDIADRQIGKARAVADRILPKPVDIDVLLREFDRLPATVPSAAAPLPLN